MNTLLTETRGKTLIVTINRPEALNALNITVIDELSQVFSSFRESGEWQGAILTGAGEKAFVAGADISEINKMTKEQALLFGKAGQSTFAMLESTRKPIIAAVNGFALGGGCELAMSCHLRIAAEHAKFGQPEVNLGLIAGFGGTQRMPRLVGLGKGLELLLTADMVTAADALTLGLVNAVVPKDQLMNACITMLEKIYTKSPLAVALTMDAVYQGAHHSHNEYEHEAGNFTKSVSSEDGKEGTAAFLEKRKPLFTGK